MIKIVVFLRVFMSYRQADECGGESRETSTLATTDNKARPVKP